MASGAADEDRHERERIAPQPFADRHRNAGEEHEVDEDAEVGHGIAGIVVAVDRGVHERATRYVTISKPVAIRAAT